jgi:hypothetical protein
MQLLLLLLLAVLLINAVSFANGRRNPIGPIRATFGLPQAWLGILLLFGIPVLVLAWTTSPLLGIAASFVLTINVLTIWRCSTVRIADDGIELYRINRMRWSDITRARLRHVFALPYVVIGRARGMPWMIPLYFVGEGDLRQALVRLAPRGHPIRACIECDWSPPVLRPFQLRMRVIVPAAIVLTMVAAWLFSHR